jgi:hypothetical protein
MTQLESALYPGGKAEVERQQTDTGTRDKITEHWLELLYNKVREARSNDPSFEADTTANNLCEWLYSQPGDKWNPLLDTLSG